MKPATRSMNFVRSGGTKSATMMQMFDTIVIGSGMGGMAAASLLSQCQKDHRVLVLEQNKYHCCQSFERNGYRFGVGLHYVFDMDEKSQQKQLLDALTPEGDPIEWSRMPDKIDSVMIGKDEFRRYDAMVANRQEESLIEQFPKEKEAIKKFFELARMGEASMRRAFVFKCLPSPIVSFLINTGLDRLFDKGYRKLSKKTLKEVVDSLTKDEDLRALLEYLFADHGGAPETAAFLIHALLYLGYSRGAYYPTGGPGMIPEKISRAITACGGEVRINAPVKRILVEEGQAIGVELEDGTTIGAKHVISDAGYVNTFHHLLPVEYRPADVPPTLDNGMTGAVLFVGLEGDEGDFHLPHQHLWVFPDSRLDTLSDRLSEKTTLATLQSMKVEDLPVIVTLPSGKDRSWKKTFDGKTTLEIMMPLVPWKAFADVIDDRGVVKENKKQEYEQFKRIFGQMLWARSRQALIAAGASVNLPEHLDDADFAEVGTPLTFSHFLGRSAWYGLDHGIARFQPHQFYLTLRPECNVRGLYITGQDLGCLGAVGGALIGGYLCAGKVLGENNPFNLIQKVSVNRAKVE